MSRPGRCSRFAAFGYDTDTCGSIRIPASSNSLFGLGPTKGLVSMDGVIPLSHTQDIAGPLARTVADLAIGLDAIVGADPADPSTRVLACRPPPRFGDALRSDALRGARIGVLAAYFGSEAEDAEAGDLVRRALERMRELGAEVIEVEIPRLDSLVSGSSVIDHEFKFDLLDYLAAAPDPPIDSLGDILARGLYHPALEGSFRRRNGTAARETDAYRRARERRAALRDSVIGFMDRELSTRSRTPRCAESPRRIGEPQRGSNCQLSASTGTPALAIPAGFTTDGLPIAVELLGRPFDDAKLVGFAFALRAGLPVPPAAAAHAAARPLTPRLAPAKSGPQPGFLRGDIMMCGRGRAGERQPRHALAVPDGCAEVSVRSYHGPSEAPGH